jgi:hypothetical protein
MCQPHMWPFCRRGSPYQGRLADLQLPYTQPEATDQLPAADYPNALSRNIITRKPMITPQVPSSSKPRLWVSGMISSETT